MSNKDPNYEYNKSYAQTRGEEYIHGTNERAGWSTDHSTSTHRNHTSGSSGSGCLSAGTQILCPSGNRPIESIRQGETILTRDPDSNLVVEKRVLKTRHYRQKRLFRIHLENGTQLQSTEIHSFYANGVWRKVRELEVGDDLGILDSSNRSVRAKIAHIEPLPRREDVFNLIVEFPGTFFANGVETHSFSYLRPVRTAIWTVLGSLGPRPGRFGSLQPT